MLAMSFPIEILWQSCGNVLAGSLQRLMTYVWVYRVINCVFSGSFFLSQSLLRTTSSFFSVALKNFLPLRNMIKSISFSGSILFRNLFDINLGILYVCDEIFASFALYDDYMTRILLTYLNDAFSHECKCCNINVWKNVLHLWYS